MSYPKKIYKYRFTDYSKLSDKQLLSEMKGFMNKLEYLSDDQQIDLNFISKAFSNFMNLREIVEEIKARLDPGSLEELNHEISIENIKRKLNLD